ncbi:MAG: orotidine-5'-phosphate decarboxylase [Synergistaceae bacterium]|jgi:orotidine-5'-phosphate decarboxylase|nr:orotidine-5'-phosphate decarboxylase [Synergistaceae bacterium]
MTSIDRLIEAIETTGNPAALGLDTRAEYLPPSFRGDFPDPAGAVRAFNRVLIDTLADIVPCVKVQAACYEALGPEGMRTFRDTLLYAREKGLITIADVKRNDIGSTAEAYAAAYLGGESLAPFSADFVTINAYLGSDGVNPFLTQCEKNGGGIFVLVRTSNPSAGEFQNLSLRGADGMERPLYEHMGLKAAEWGSTLMGEHGYSSVGAVVGATWPDEGKRLRELLPHTFFLVPGYGAQGATAKDLAGCFDGKGRGVVVNASRSLLLAYKKRNTENFAAAARDETLKMRDDLRKIIEER